LGLAAREQELAQQPADGRDPVGPLQLDEELKRFGQPGERCLVIVAGQVDLARS
jgi:hypothetical protein